MKVKLSEMKGFIITISKIENITRNNPANIIKYEIIKIIPYDLTLGNNE
jgi:hypothetical protein